MTTAIHTISGDRADLLAIATAAFLGLAVIFTVGFAKSDTLHDAAHDMRHATGFACH